MTLRSVLHMWKADHSWGMGVVSHSYDGFGGGLDGGCGLYACGS